MNLIAALVALPLLAAGISYTLNSNRVSRALLVVGAASHLIVAILCLLKAPFAEAGDWLALDAPGCLFLLITSSLFMAAALQTSVWLGRDRQIGIEGFDKAHHGSGRMPERIFVPCMLAFLSMMTLVICARHFGILWVSMEATTLASAPLICFHRSDRSLEAMWKYLLVCSVGIGLALFGSMLLAAAAKFAPDEIGLGLDELLSAAPSLHQGWLKMAFVFILAGYGAKIGLAPFHTWLPDAHSEAPATVSALLSGSLLNCAFLGMLRIREVCVAAGIGDFCKPFLIALGLLSLLVAAAFIIGQTDFKRLLAYSSVEHMGIAALGIGIGGDAIFGSVYHLLNHSLTKGMLFMLAGNLLLRYGTRSIADVRGAIKACPWTGALWLAGLLAITGTPPFGLFISEFTILTAALNGGYYAVSAIYLLLLAVAFAGLSLAFVRMAFGEPSPQLAAQGSKELALRSESPWLVVSPLALGLATLALGVWLPAPLGRLINAVLMSLG